MEMKRIRKIMPQKNGNNSKKTERDTLRFE
jgi:hypothetical protein